MIKQKKKKIKHLEEIENSLTLPSGIVYRISYDTNSCKTHCGAACGASVLICTSMQCCSLYAATSPTTMAYEQSVSSSCLW